MLFLCAQIAMIIMHPLLGKRFCSLPTRKGLNQRSKDVTQTQQQRPKSPTVTLALLASKDKVHHKLHQTYIFFSFLFRSLSSSSFFFFPDPFGFPVRISWEILLQRDTHVCCLQTPHCLQVHAEMNCQPKGKEQVGNIYIFCQADQHLHGLSPLQGKFRKKKL